MMRSTLFFVLGALLCGLATLPATAHACKCMLPTPEQAREAAPLIFEGRVSAIEDVPAKPEEGVGTKRVTLALVRTWKGLESKESVVVSTSASSASCGFMFEPNTSYLVYAAEGEGGVIEVSGCSRTRAMTDAADDLAVLGAGITPVEVKPADKPADKPGETTGNEPPKAAPRTGGCGSTSGTAQASLSLMLLPVTGLVLQRRRRHSKDERSQK